jgi:hypothetical protein
MWRTLAVRRDGTLYHGTARAGGSGLVYALVVMPPDVSDREMADLLDVVAGELRAEADAAEPERPGGSVYELRSLAVSKRDDDGDGAA